LWEVQYRKLTYLNYLGGGTIMASLKLKNVYKRYAGGVTAVSDFNLDIEDKEFLILVGPSGCGKSTTLRMIAGLEEISEGELYIGDKLVNDVAPKDRDIAMVFQNYALYPHMTVFENMAFGLKLRKTPKDEIKRRVNEAAKILDIAHLLDRKPKALSGGQRQRVALGRAIVREPKVFLMDEPLSNLDAKLRVQMRTEISKLHQRLQTTFIYVTHDQTEAMTMGTRIVVMKDGFIQQVDTPQTLYEKPCNMFVAGFIGSPQMNFINVKVQKKEDGIHLVFGKNDIKLPEGKAKKLEGTEYIGKEVVMGIRPENLHDEEAYLSSMPDSIVESKIDVVEMMGAETFLYMTVEGVNFTARVNPRTKAKAGDTVKIALDVNKIHLFDKDTERTIIN
jgi:multiple sugar transport system ATP-binding protein